MTQIAAYIGALFAFFVADMAWLSFMVPRFYRPVIGDMLLPGVNLMPAIAFYLLLPAGLVVFAIGPALKEGSILTALTMGALFGFFTYATYDLTNQATLRNWSTMLSLVDIAWGSVLGAGTAAWAFWVVGKLIPQN